MWWAGEGLQSDRHSGQSVLGNCEVYVLQGLWALWDQIGPDPNVSDTGVRESVCQVQKTLITDVVVPKLERGEASVAPETVCELGESTDASVSEVQALQHTGRL